MAELSVLRIDPVYDSTTKSSGYFEVHSADRTEPFMLSFVPFLDHNVRNNKELFEYLKKYVKSDTTMSDVVYHLYDIGFPLNEWVEEYMGVLANSSTDQLLNTLSHLLSHIKNFGK